MGNESQTSEPRSRFVVRRTAEILRQSTICVRKFATDVAIGYMSRTSEHERIVRFYTGNGSIDSACKAERLNAKIVQHYLDGDVKFPADLEEAWIAALPELQRNDTIRALAARYGLLGARLPGQSQQHPLCDLSDVLRDAGATAQVLAPLFARGELEVANLPQLRRAAAEISRSVADLVSLQAQVAIALEAKPTRMERAA